jgi:hypothetical protein
MTGFTVDPLGLANRTMDGHNLVLLEDLPLTCPDGSTVTCLAGAKVSRIFDRPIRTQSDGASTPRPLWGTGLPPFGWYFLPVVAHDCAYRMFTRPILNREESDELLLWALEAQHGFAMSLGVSQAEYAIQKAALYEGVRIFGEHAFLEDRTQRA